MTYTDIDDLVWHEALTDHCDGCVHDHGVHALCAYDGRCRVIPVDDTEGPGALYAATLREVEHPCRECGDAATVAGLCWRCARDMRELQRA